MPNDVLINRMASALTAARELSRVNLETWVTNHERTRGGLIVIRAAFRQRDLPEIEFRSENWAL